MGRAAETTTSSSVASQTQAWGRTATPAADNHRKSTHAHLSPTTESQRHKKDRQTNVEGLAMITTDTDASDVIATFFSRSEINFVLTTV